MSVTTAVRQPSRRSMRPALLVFVTCALAAWSSVACAWSARGHQMVGDIASALLTPAATLAVDELLRDDLGADGKPSGRSTLGQVASWPDEIRATPEQKATGVYHFDDVPICGVPDPARYCPDGQCGTVWFKKQLAILKDRSQTPRARNEALKWIVHLVGDLHQPLHASDHDDKGGNDVQITFLGKRSDTPVAGRTEYPYNLHTAWDRLIPYSAFDHAGGYPRFLANMPTVASQAAWRVGTMDQWAAESFVLARDFIYPSLPIGFTCGQPITGVVALDARVDQSSEVIAAEQLRKAGVRLAKVLNDSLAGPGADIR